MSTFLVTLGVVVTAVAAALAVAVKDPEQPATLRTRTRRERRAPRPPRRAPAPGPAPAVVPDPAERPAVGLADQWVPVPAGISGWVRLRSGVVLTVLLAVVGALLAFSISGILLLIALAVRDAVS